MHVISVRRILRSVLFGLLLLFNFLSASQQSNNDEKKSIYHELLREVGFHHTIYFIIIGCFVLMVPLLQLNFIMCHPISKFCTESFILVIFGILIGLVIFFGIGPLEIFNVDLFNFVLLPFIMMDAGWNFPNKAVFKNSIPVFCFAMLGTIFNALALSAITYGVAKMSLKFKLLNFKPYENLNYERALMFSIVLSAVDPVAVLAVFESIHVNHQLYGIVFGESLFNDGVAIVGYTIMEKIGGKDGYKEYELKDIFIAGIVKFFLSSLLGVLIGFFFAALAGALTKYTYHMTFIEPIVVLGILYLSYLFTESVHYSAVFAIITTSILAKPCVSENIAKSSNTALQYIIKMLGHTSEGAVFILIGITNIHSLNFTNIDWILISIVYLGTLVIRFISVFGFSFIMNSTCLGGSSKISYKNQLIMGYSGLRGAIALALGLSMFNNKFKGNVDPLEESLGAKLNNTILFIVILTVAFQGSTVSSIINCFKVKKATEEKNPLFKSINEPAMEEILKSIGLVAHHSSESYIISLFKKIYERYLRSFFVSTDETRAQYMILKKYNEVADKGVSSIADSNLHKSKRKLTSQYQIAVLMNKGEGVRTYGKNQLIDEELEADLEKLEKNRKANILQRRQTINTPAAPPKLDDLKFELDNESQNAN